MTARRASVKQLNRDIRESLAKRGSLSLLRSARANSAEADPARDLLLQLGYKPKRVERALTPYTSPYEWAVATGSGLMRLFRSRKEALAFRDEYMKIRLLDYGKALRPRVVRTSTVSNWAGDSEARRKAVLGDVDRMVWRRQIAGKPMGKAPPP